MNLVFLQIDNNQKLLPWVPKISQKEIANVLGGSTSYARVFSRAHEEILVWFFDDDGKRWDVYCSGERETFGDCEGGFNPRFSFDSGTKS